MLQRLRQAVVPESQTHTLWLNVCVCTDFIVTADNKSNDKVITYHFHAEKMRKKKYLYFLIVLKGWVCEIWPNVLLDVIKGSIAVQKYQ